MKSKKGSFIDIFTYMIVAFVMIVSVVILVFAANTVKNELETNVAIFQAAIPGHNATQIMEDTVGKAVDSLESLKWIMTMLLIGMFISIIIAAFIVRTHPVMIVPFILLWIIAIIVSVPLSNTYETLHDDPVLNEYFVDFQGATFIFNNLPIWMSVLGGIAGFVTFVNMIRQNQYGGFS